MTTFKYDTGPPPLRPDEPFFFLRAQDVLAPFAVQAYAALLRASAFAVSTQSEHDKIRVDNLREQADECEYLVAAMLAWQATNGHKLPD